ncbi:SapC family protein [Sphingomonas sp.]|uniref:SapC family protein n=1 Tax=Sphingomonas sp. TaxID=28214 RepID=UPI003B3B606D
MRLVELSRAEHGHLRFSAARIKALAAEVHMVPLVASELRKAAATYPILFAKNGETGQFYPAALMGLQPHENLFWDGAELDAAYVPLNLMRQPFYIGGEAQSGTMCVDLDSPVLDPEGDHAILEKDGSDSRYIGTIHAILNELAAQQTATRSFVEAALTRDLVTPIALDIRFADGSSAALDGLYGIDEQRLGHALREIDDAQEALTLAALAISLDHIAGLVRRKNRQIEADKAWLS